MVSFKLVVTERAPACSNRGRVVIPESRGAFSFSSKNRLSNAEVEITLFLHPLSGSMSPPLPLDILDQIFIHFKDDLDDLVSQDAAMLAGWGLPVHMQGNMEAFIPIAKSWSPLLNLIKVNKSWHAAGLVHLYSSITIIKESRRNPKPIGECLPMLIRTLRENKEISQLVKRIAISDFTFDTRFDVIKQEHYEELFQLCQSAIYLHFCGRTPIDRRKFQDSISGMANLRKLRIQLPHLTTYNFFRDDVEMIRFIMTMPHLENVAFNCVDGMFSEMEEKSIYEQEETTKCALPLYSTLSLNTLDISNAGFLTGKGVELLASLALPRLKLISLKFSPSERAYTAVQQCLNKWPETLDSLHIRDRETRREVIPTGVEVRYSEAIDRFAHLSSIDTRRELVNLDHILSKPSLKEITYNGELSDVEFDILTRKLEETVPDSEGKVYTYLPSLRRLKIYWGKLTVRRTIDFKRIDAICHSRQLRLEIVSTFVHPPHADPRTDNVFCVEIPTIVCLSPCCVHPQTDECLCLLVAKINGTKPNATHSVQFLTKNIIFLTIIILESHFSRTYR